MLKRLIICLTLALAGVVGLTTVQAGAGPCAISGSDQGWYWHKDKVMQCVIDSGNHMVIRQWGAGGVDEGVVLNAWYPASSYYWVTVRPAYHASGSPLAFCPHTSQGVSDLLTTTAGVPYGWEQQFYWQPQNYSAGAINHFLNWPGSQAYGLYAHFTSGNCPYGGSATTFTWG